MAPPKPRKGPGEGALCGPHPTPAPYSMTRSRAASVSAWTPLCGGRPLCSSSRRWATTRAAGPPQWGRKSRRRRRPAPAWAQAVQQARQPAAGPLRSADDVASTSECGSAEGALHLLWSTPLWTSNALECGAVDESFNERLTSLALDGYNDFARQQTQLDERLRDDISWLSHAFFEWQQLQYHSNGGWPALYQSPDYHALESLVRSSVASMMSAVGMTDAGQDTSLMVWCAMHHDGTEHREHVHPDVLMSGTCESVFLSRFARLRTIFLKKTSHCRLRALPGRIGTAGATRTVRVGRAGGGTHAALPP